MKNVRISGVKALDKRQAIGQDARVVVVETVAINWCPEPMKEYLEAINRHGGLFDQSRAARVAGVSSQRIHQLIEAGRLPLVNVMVEIEGRTLPLEQLIPGNALLAWMKEPKNKGGRPTHRASRPELQAA